MEATAQTTAIKASDLRIGNWVHKIHSSVNRSLYIEESDFPMETIDCGFVKVLEIVEKGIVDFIDTNPSLKQIAEYEDLQPIPLTPEILEKCGFQKDSIDFILPLKHGSLQSPLSGEYVVFGLEVNDLFYDAHESDIKYLHQLQNLYFALTCEELQINL
jgi:hypothetical protein